MTGGRQARLGGRCEGGWFVEPTLGEGLAAGAARTRRRDLRSGGDADPLRLRRGGSAGRQRSALRLAASVWTRDLVRAHRFSAALESGIVWVNTWMLRDLRTPFGGMKDSGVGREGGQEALRFFTEAQNICIDLQGG